MQVYRNTSSSSWTIKYHRPAAITIIKLIRYLFCFLFHSNFILISILSILAHVNRHTYIYYPIIIRVEIGFGAFFAMYVNLMGSMCAYLWWGNNNDTHTKKTMQKFTFTRNNPSSGSKSLKSSGCCFDLLCFYFFMVDLELLYGV